MWDMDGGVWESNVEMNGSRLEMNGHCSGVGGVHGIGNAWKCIGNECGYECRK
jgi:hypothetical protein